MPITLLYDAFYTMWHIIWHFCWFLQPNKNLYESEFKCQKKIREQNHMNITVNSIANIVVIILYNAIEDM